MNTVKDTLEYILKSILPETDTINVDEVEKDSVTILEISVPPEKAGQIIGKEGRIIKAIRTILAISYPNQRFSLEIKD
ncbi:MAG: KH domain-containing protein [Candidatus Shapirobacteria bacterium]|nr:KH domain-containing protein [Candidatus Shapirobacteria bacterium]